MPATGAAGRAAQRTTARVADRRWRDNGTTVAGEATRANPSRVAASAQTTGRVAGSEGVLLRCRFNRLTAMVLPVAGGTVQPGGSKRRWPCQKAPPVDAPTDGAYSFLRVDWR
jgi:hypothetical protein